MPSEFNLATPLAGNINMTAFVQVLREELERIDHKRLYVYLFETVDESLLDILAAQFDMLGYNGWILADTVQAKRELLKAAFELHILKGTPAGVIEVAKRLGFEGVELVEGWDNFNDGSPEPAINPWSHFKANYKLSDERSLNANAAQDLTGLVNNYKNARSILSSFEFTIDRTEVIRVKDTLTLNIINV